MTTPIWSAGTLYAPGALVRPASALAPSPEPVANGGFEEGNVDWQLGAGMTIVQPGPGGTFEGTWSLNFDANGIARATNLNRIAVTPGQIINGSLQAVQNFAGGVAARAEIGWYDASDILISYSEGNDVSIPAHGGWQQSTVNGTAPVGAAYARFVVRGNRTSGSHVMWLDNCQWDASSAALSAGLVFKAVQAIAGYSGNGEPTWPLVNGQTVVDNQVTWEATFASRVVWEASPILVSGSYEPTWPIGADGTVLDGSIVWVAMNARIADVKCPQSAVVAIAASKIFAADRDIIAFSATTNPLDWSTAQDAGFLPFGLQTYGSTPCTALGLYRSNLVAFNDQGYQMWQVDEDPANMALLDASPIDCPYHKSVQPVSNDLVFLTAQGVRNIGIAGASTNLQAGFFGKQIDPLVLTKIREGLVPRALFWPGAGQYWLFFGAKAFVLTMNGGPKDASWTRYEFPDTIDAWTILDSTLYLRAGNLVWEVDAEALDDDMQTPDVPVVPGFTIPATAGTYLVWVDGVHLRQTQSVLGLQAPNGWGVTAGNRVELPDGGKALICNARPTFGANAMAVQVFGEDINGGAISEIVSTGASDIFAVGATTFYAITGSSLLSGSADVGYVVGYQTFTPDPDSASTVLIVDLRGYIAVEETPTSVAMTLRGMTAQGYPVSLPADSAITVMRVSNNGASLTFVVNSVENIVMPVGAVGALTAGVDTYSALTNLKITTGASAPTVQVGVRITVDLAPVGTPFAGYLSWPYIDFGRLGVDKEMESFDLVCNGGVNVQFGYSQKDLAAVTTAYHLDGETIPGNPVPYAITAPSFQMRLTFDSSQAWEWFAAGINLSDQVGSM